MKTGTPTKKDFKNKLRLILSIPLDLLLEANFSDIHIRLIVQGPKLITL